MYKILYEHMFSFLWYIPEAGISGSYDNFMFNLLTNNQTVFQSGCIFLHSHQQCRSITVFYILVNSYCLPLKNYYSNSIVYEIDSHCDFNLHFPWAFLMAQRVKRLPTMWETQVRALGQKDPLEKEMATHSSTPAWKIPWMEKPVGYSTCGCKQLDMTDLLIFLYCHFAFLMESFETWSV